MVKVKLFANFREITGKKEIEFDARTVGELLNTLVKTYPELEEHFSKNKLKEYVHIMVNGKIVDDLDTKLKKDDVVAIFPPVSGGWVFN